MLVAREGFLLDARVQQHREGLREFGLKLLVLADADASEERLVRQAAVLVVAARVDTSDVGGEVEAVVDVVAGLGVVVVMFREPLVEVGAEPILVLLELLEAQRVFQMRLEETVLLGQVLGAPKREICGLGRRGFREAIQCMMEHAAQRISSRRVDLTGLDGTSVACASTLSGTPTPANRASSDSNVVTI
ncbi:hypothetical protein [Tessaracoccus caeni]|uniref:hypothetical protein n=1 Tax=Tessaracoccus caeni TaxID=3031239 RepID=UPI0023DB6D99|nr:hypothetical protein [Tessaracoccus caeni]MDF1487113.1 hypothetical protein [Tessaracoccus caeni]